MPLMEFYCIASQYYDTEVLDYFISRILVLLFKRRGKRLCFTCFYFRSQRSSKHLFICVYMLKSFVVLRPQGKGQQKFSASICPQSLSISEQIQTHAFIFLCLMQRRSLLPKVKWQVDIWQRCITEALGLQQMIFSHQR